LRGTSPVTDPQTMYSRCTLEGSLLMNSRP
jgi:hypothetical protein